MFNVKRKVVEDLKMCCWSLLTSRVSGSKSGLAVGPLMLHHLNCCFPQLSTAFPKDGGSFRMWG